MTTGAFLFSDMGGTPMPRGTGVPPVDLPQTEMRPMTRLGVKPLHLQAFRSMPKGCRA
jgi:hypothetical protein